jgi:flagellar hook-length control protein FliK
MSQFELSNMIGPRPPAAVLPDSALLEAQGVGSDSFHEHLQRAQGRTADTGGSGSTPAAAPTERPSEPEAQAGAGERPCGPNDTADRQTDDQAASPPGPTEREESSSSGAARAENAAVETHAAGSPKSETVASDAEVSKGNQTETAQPGSPARRERAKKPRDEAGKGESKVERQADRSLQPGDSAAHQQAAEPGTQEQVAAGTGEADLGQSEHAPARLNPKSGRGFRKTRPREGGNNTGRQSPPLASRSTVEEESSTVAQETAGGKRASFPSVPQPKPPARADNHAADDAFAEAAGGAAEAVSEPARPRRQSKVAASQAEAPRHPQRREKQVEPAAGRSDQPGPEQPSPKVEVAAIAPEFEAPTAVGGAIVSAAKQGIELAAEAIKPASGERAGKQPAVPVREAAGTQSAPASPAPPAKASDVGPADHARFVQRVARAFQSVGDRGGTIRLRLSPPELGSLRMEISVRGGVMTARLEAENQTTRKLLLDNLPALRDRLAQQDIQVERFHVELMEQSPGGLPQHTADSTPSDNRGGNYHAPRAHAEPLGEAPRASDAGAARRPGTGSHLNVIV